MSEAFKISPVRLEEFQAMDFGDRKVELIDGMIVVAHAFPSSRHADIAAGIATMLNIHFRNRERSCRAQIGAGLPVRLINDFELGPDVLVHCGGDRERRGAATLVVEVLSPSNRPKELDRKLAAYRTVDSLRHILLVNQDDYAIEHWHRGDDGQWHADLIEGENAVLRLPDWDAAWSLGEFYGDS